MQRLSEKSCGGDCDQQTDGDRNGGIKPIPPPVIRMLPAANATAPYTAAPAAMCRNVLRAFRSPLRADINSRVDPVFTAMPTKATCITVSPGTETGSDRRCTSPHVTAPTPTRMAMALSNAARMVGPPPQTPRMACGHGPFSKHRRAPGNQQSRIISQVMRRIGQQRERSSDLPSHALDNHICGVQPHRPAKGGAKIGGRAMVVIVGYRSDFPGQRSFQWHRR